MILGKIKVQDFKRNLYTCKSCIKDIPINVLVKNISDAVYDLGMKTPEAQVYSFYTMNHIVYSYLEKQCISRLDTLGEGLVSEYLQKQSREAVRLFYYLLIACVREYRHTPKYSKYLGEKNGIDYTPLGDKSQALEDFFLSLKKSRSSSLILTKFLSLSSDLFMVGQLLLDIHRQFLFGRWASNSLFGGKLWSTISGLLLSFVSGEISPEIMQDQAYSLSHNTGFVFNKGVFYKNYKYSHLVFLLDLQRLGCLPSFTRYVLSGNEFKIKMSLLKGEVIHKKNISSNFLIAPGKVFEEGMLFYKKYRSVVDDCEEFNPSILRSEGLRGNYSYELVTGDHNRDIIYFSDDLVLPYV
jgi:hypothetical protein